MKILIAVPSKGRSSEINKDTLRWLKECKYDWKIFVEPQEYADYLQRFRKEGGESDPFVNIGQNNLGLGFAKKQIHWYAKNNNYEAIFKVDDDVQSWYAADRKNARDKSPEVFEKAIQDGQEAFRRWPDVKAISYPYSFQMWTTGKKWSDVNLRTQTSYLVLTDFLHPDARISTFEDFATFIYIRANNGIVLRYGLCGIDCRDIGSNTGGHQSFDRREQAEKEIDYLRELYPALKARKVDKPWRIEPDLRDSFFGAKEL